MVVIPVYNEIGAIENTLYELKSVLATIKNFETEIVCVEDGSNDGTKELLTKQVGIRNIFHPVNRGYGAALRTGLESCSEGNPWIFILDADGTYPIHLLPEILSYTNKGHEMVIGARVGKGISNAPFKRVARWILRKMVYYLSGTFVPDLNSGMRVFRYSLYKEFRHLLPTGFSFTSTLTVASLYKGYSLKYISIPYEKRIGKSNIDPVKDFLGFVILFVRLASYFEPLRFFIPASLFIFLIGVMRGLRDIYISNSIGSLSVILFFFAFQIFVTGILADVVVRRSQSPYDKT